MRSAVVRERRGPLRVVAVAAVAVGMLVGCGSGPSQIGAAALVGDTVIPVDRVQQQLDIVLTKEGEQAKTQLVAGSQLDDVSREILTQAVRHELLAVTARREGLSVDDEQIDDVIGQLGGPEMASAGTVYDAQGIRTRAQDQLLAVELGRKYVPRLSATVDYTTAGTRTAAMQRVQQLSEAGSERAGRSSLPTPSRVGRRRWTRTSSPRRIPGWLPPRSSASMRAPWWHSPPTRTRGPGW